MAIPEDTGVPWLLLTFTLPSRRASQRVEIRRKLQRYGSVSLGNSGYLLPTSSANEERFRWLAEAIRKYGGEASVVQVNAIDNLSTPQLTGRFSDARTREYQEVIRELHRRGRNVRPGDVTRLRNRFQEIAEVDFFNSPLQRRVRELLERADPLHAAKQQKPTIRIDVRDYKRRMWVTRSRPGVDRCACDGELPERGMQLAEGLYFAQTKRAKQKKRRSVQVTQTKLNSKPHVKKQEVSDV